MKGLLQRLMFVLASVLFLSPSAFAASSSGIGLNVGTGVPYLQQVELNYQASNNFGMALGYNVLDLSVDSATAKLSMVGLMLHYHPFEGSFFLGAGAGMQALKVSATDSLTSLTAAIESDATVAVGKLGWMWGLGNKGFWFGIDTSFVSPMGAKETITAPGVPTTSQEYIDALDAAKLFGSTSYMNVTVARLGWLF